ncbi:hypothetical protein GWL_08560 [Herbaspirillum sp. GW103]|nr:hypothetical protein GWL_08560 [Herbaspirillum sp. GW103]
MAWGECRQTGACRSGSRVMFTRQGHGRCSCGMFIRDMPPVKTFTKTSFIPRTPFSRCLPGRRQRLPTGLDGLPTKRNNHYRASVTLPQQYVKPRSP